MEKRKMSLANMQGKLSRGEMKKVLGGCSGSAQCADAYAQGSVTCLGNDTSTAQGYNAYTACMGNVLGSYANCFLANCGELPY